MSTLFFVGGVVGGIAALAVSAAAGAAHQYSSSSKFTEIASVTAAMQVTAASQEECRDEVVTFTRDPKHPDRIVRIVAGSAVGDGVGNPSGSSGGTAVTIGGTVAGDYADNKIQEAMRGRNVYATPQRVCRAVQNTRTSDVTSRLTLSVSNSSRASTTPPAPASTTGAVAALDTSLRALPDSGAALHMTASRNTHFERA